MIINRYAKGGGLSPRIVVSVKTGTTVTCSKGATTLTATSVDGKCSFNVNDYGVWTVSTDSDTQTVNVEYVQLYEVTLKTASSTLNDNDWSTIKSVADKSQGANYWAVGDTKQITMNGKVSDGLTLSNYSTYVYIIGFNHNSSVEGTGIAFGGFKTAASGGIDVALCDSGYGTDKTSGQWFNMNNSNTSSGGWKNSRMRSTTLPLVKSALPSELTSVIKTTTIYSDNTGGGSDTASHVTATQDELYLLAEFEIFGARTLANSAERNYQQQYAYYVAGNSKIKYRHDNTATAIHWWERSARATAANHFGYVVPNGTASGYFANYSYGLAVAFKVGGVVTKPASTLSVGSSVYVKESGIPAEYIVVQQGNPYASTYDSSCDGTWLLRKDCYSKQVYATNGINNYEDSSILAYINSTFYSVFDTATKSVIKQVKIPYMKGPGNTGTVMSGENGLLSNCFLLSCNEVGFGGTSSVSSEGVKLDYFVAGFGGNPQRIAYFNGTATDWWLRSPRTDSSNTQFSILASGTPGTPPYTVSNNSLGVRPCFIISSDTEVDEFGNIVV